MRKIFLGTQKNEAASKFKLKPREYYNGPVAQLGRAPRDENY